MTEFLHSHHKYWGKLYPPGEAKIVWHVPNEQEIAFALEIFDRLIGPTLDLLDALLEDGVVRDASWRNDFCRHLTFVKEAFSGVGTLAKEEATEEERAAYLQTTDLPSVLCDACCGGERFTDAPCGFRESLPEMIASGEPVACGFPLNDPKDPRYQKFMKYRRRFANFMLKSSRVLRLQGEENTVDPILMLVSPFFCSCMAYIN